ncbi:MAG: zinc carboxypeptidase, partial [Brevundimonas sp.]
YVVSRSQPLRRMAEVLLTRDIPVPADFMARQAERRDRGLGDELYDVTAWSLPLMFNVPAEACGAAPQVATTAVGPELVRPAAVANPEARYGWLIHPGAAGQKLTIALLRQGVAARAMLAPFTHESGAWPAGTVLVPRAGQPSDLSQRLQALAAATGARVVGVDGSWTTSGISFGSAEAVGLTLPNVLLAWDEPTSPTAAGAARHILEREFGLPVTAARTARLAGADLNRYPVIVLPDGSDYAGRLGARGIANLRAWVERGGILVTLGSGPAALVADADNKLGAVRLETDPEDEEAGTERTLLTTEAELRAAVLGTERPTSVAGAQVRARTDAEHRRAAGGAPALMLLAQGAATNSP